MNPLARFGKLRNDKHLATELQRVGDALDEQFTRALPQLDPSYLRTRLEPTMEDLSTSDQQNARITFDPLPTTPKRSRAAGGMALALVAGVVGTSAAFLTFGNNSTKPAATDIAQVATTQSELQYLTASYIPADFCLFFANVQEPGDDENMYAPEQFLLKGDKSGAISIMVMGAMMGGMPPSLTGENVDINGSTASLSGKAPNLSLSWKKGKTSVTMQAKDVTKEPLLAIARSIVLRFDENGAQIGSIVAEGFSQQAQPDPSTRVGGYANWGKCGATFGPDEFPSVNLNVSRPNPLGEEFSFGLDNVNIEESVYPVKRNGKTIKAKKVIMDFEGRKNTSVSWTENDTTVNVGVTKLDDGELAKIIAGLTPISKADLKKLAKTARPPTGGMGGPEAGFPTDGPNKIQDLDSFTEGTTEITIRAGVKDGKLCPAISYGSGSNSPNCLSASAKPKFMMSMGGNNFSLSQAATDGTVVKAQMVFADGTTKEIRSVIDPRLPKVRLFVLYRKNSDPTPAKIQFFDASGKVVSEQ